MKNENFSLEERSINFAVEVQQTLDGVLPSQAVLVTEHLPASGRFLVHPDGEGRRRWIDLTIRGTTLAYLDLVFFLTLDHADRYLKAVRSDIKVWSADDNIPLVRLEYRSDMRNVPVAHWHVHAPRDRFDKVFRAAADAARGSTKNQRDLSAMHLPVGGERFRPCLEDLLEFLIRELGVDAQDGWEDVVCRGRVNWRLRQLRSAVRDNPDQAAQVLRESDWHVSPPSVGSLNDHNTNERW